MMYVGDVPWHGSGEYVGEENVDAKTAIKKAGLDWLVKTKPGKVELGGKEIDIPTHKVLYRDTDEKFLACLGRKYVPFQNHEGFEFLDALVDEGEMRYHTAGSLRDGKRIWILGKIKGALQVVPQDIIDKYVMLWNSHDGSSSIRILPTGIRVVCANTARLALTEGAKEGVRIRHGQNVKKKIELAKEALGLAHNKFEEFGEFAKFLVGKNMDKAKWDEFAEHMFPNPPGPLYYMTPEGKPGQNRNLRAVKNRGRLLKLFEGGRGQDIPGVSGTFWAAYNAVTEYANYQRTTRGGQEVRFESSLFGSGADFIDRATDWFRQAA